MTHDICLKYNVDEIFDYEISEQMYNESLSEIEDEIKLMNDKISLTKTYDIEYKYINYDDRILNNDNHNKLIDIEKYK